MSRNGVMLLLCLVSDSHVHLTAFHVTIMFASKSGITRSLLISYVVINGFISATVILLRGKDKVTGVKSYD